MSTQMENVENMVNVFIEKFGDGGKIERFFSPGRVNLIGEHIDYNGGSVLPCALTIGTYGVFRKRDDNKVRCYSMNFEKKGIIEFSLDNLVYDAKDDWTNYVKGVIWAFADKYHKIDKGFDFLCYGTIPNGSGLSSSASIELLVSRILIDEYGYDVDMVEASLLSQTAENKFIGVNCGIMDQFAIAMGKDEQAILLNTDNLDYTYVPCALGNYKIIIANTNKPRKLADSKYNERRGECETALGDIQEVKKVDYLAHLSSEEFESVKDAIKDDICRKRATHVVYENERTRKAIDALKEGNLEQFGKLLNESHASLKDLYEVTGNELDTLVEVSQKQPGVLGSRMTGAGFGGCTISLVEESAVPAFIENVGKEYKERIGYPASFYTVQVGNGPRKL